VVIAAEPVKTGHRVCRTCSCAGLFGCSPAAAVIGSLSSWVLRHQLAILGALPAALSRLLARERWSCFVVSPRRILAGTTRCGRGRRSSSPTSAAARQERAAKQKRAAKLLGQGMTRNRTPPRLASSSRTRRNWKAAPAFRRERERQHKHAARPHTSAPSSNAQATRRQDAQDTRRDRPGEPRPSAQPEHEQPPSPPAQQQTIAEQTPAIDLEPSATVRLWPPRSKPSRRPAALTNHQPPRWCADLPGHARRSHRSGHLLRTERRLRSELDWLNDNDARHGIIPPLSAELANASAAHPCAASKNGALTSRGRQSLRLKPVRWLTTKLGRSPSRSTSSP
jgi:hypothetical protein